MNTDTLNLILNDPCYKAHCKRLCKGRYIFEDLYQEFILAVCEKSDQLANDFSSKPIELKKFCYGIISNIFGMRGRNKSKIHELKTFLNNLEERSTYHEYMSEGEDETIIQKQIKENRIQRVKECLNKADEHDVFVLYISINQNLKKFCRDAKISYNTVRIHNARFKQQIKEEVINDNSAGEPGVHR